MQHAINELEHTREILVNNYNVGGDPDQQELRLAVIEDIDAALIKLQN